jgi:molybdopterin-guanine dinucleotide biosynthesis protein MobB
MSTPTVFGIYGDSDTGKTTLIVKLVTHFTKEGVRVATVKQTKKSLSLDTEGKDTWRHHGAGSHLVVFSSACETDFLFHQAMNTSDILQKIKEFGSYDLVFIEGADDPTIPKIQVGASEIRKNTIAQYKNNFNDVVNVIKKGIKIEQSSQQLRVIVNGKNVQLTEFPEHIITNTIMAMLASLKGVQNISEFTIQLMR